MYIYICLYLYICTYIAFYCTSARVKWYQFVERVYAIAAQSTRGSQNVQNRPRLDRFWKLRCWKISRHCGAKHMSKSRVQKTEGYGVFLDVQMSFCGQAQGGRDSALGFCIIFKRVGRCGAITTTTTTTLPSTALHYIPPQLQLQPQLQIHYITLHCTTHHFATLNCPTLQ